MIIVQFQLRGVTMRLLEFTQPSNSLNSKTAQRTASNNHHKWHLHSDKHSGDDNHGGATASPDGEDDLVEPPKVSMKKATNNNKYDFDDERRRMVVVRVDLFMWAKREVRHQSTCTTNVIIQIVQHYYMYNNIYIK